MVKYVRAKRAQGRCPPAAEAGGAVTKRVPVTRALKARSHKENARLLQKRAESSGWRGRERSEREEEGAAAALLRQKRAESRAVGGRPPARKTLRTRPPELARTGAGEVGVGGRSGRNIGPSGGDPPNPPLPPALRSQPVGLRCSWDGLCAKGLRVCCGSASQEELEGGACGRSGLLHSGLSEGDPPNPPMLPARSRNRACARPRKRSAAQRTCARPC
jgi:hypothetical protein